MIDQKVGSIHHKVCSIIDWYQIEPIGTTRIESYHLPWLGDVVLEEFWRLNWKLRMSITPCNQLFREASLFTRWGAGTFGFRFSTFAFGLLFNGSVLQLRCHNHLIRPLHIFNLTLQTVLHDMDISWNLFQYWTWNSIFL